MTEQDADKILGLIGTAKKAALKDILQKVRDGKAPSASDRQFLERYEAELKDQQDEDLPPAEYQGKAEFANPLEVTEYLQSQGWKVKKSTVYDHIKKGKLRPEENGLFQKKTIDKYASTFLTLAKTRTNLQEDDLQSKKLRIETQWKEEQWRRERLKRLQEEGRLIPRDEVDLGHAGLAAAVQDGIKYMIQTKVSSWIDLVAGDHKRTPELVQLISEDFDQVLNRLAIEQQEFELTLESTDENSGA